MTDEKWEETIDMVRQSFGVLEEGSNDLGEENNWGFVEFVVFNGPAGKTKLERTTKPVVLDKKVINPRRIGGETITEYTYSDTETFSKLKAYRWGEESDEWEEMESPV